MASQADRSQVLLDNLSNFPPLFAAVLLLCAAGLAVLRRRTWAAASVLAAAVVLAPIVPWYLPPGARADLPRRAGLKLLVANVYYRNYRHEKLIRLVREEKP